MGLTQTAPIFLSVKREEVFSSLYIVVTNKKYQSLLATDGLYTDVLSNQHYKPIHLLQQHHKHPSMTHSQVLKFGLITLSLHAAIVL